MNSKIIRVGDTVSVSTVCERLSLLPGHVTVQSYIQATKPSGYVKGQAIYVTFINNRSQWIYAGHCLKDQTSPALVEEGEVS